MATSEKIIIAELLRDPVRFNQTGRSYALLQEYFRGGAISTLRPLLKHDNVDVRRAAIWITSELGAKGRALLPEAIALLSDMERRVKYYALEVVSVCATGEHADKFAHVALALQDEDGVIRIRAMELVAMATLEQINATHRLIAAGANQLDGHNKGLSLLARCAGLNASEVLIYSRDSNPMTRKYAAIAAKKMSIAFPNLLKELTNSHDSDVSDFCAQALEDMNAN